MINFGKKYYFMFYQPLEFKHILNFELIRKEEL